MKHLDLFSGIGGFALAAKWTWGAEHELVGFCEIDKYCQKVLGKHWPDVKIYDNIKTMQGADIGTVDIITGGFPCQPFSNAGQRKGKDDDRHLWPQYLRIIQETRPRWVIGENVAGIINMELDGVLSDLERENYSVQSVVIPACAVDARHRRDRVWIIANSNESRKKPVFRTDDEAQKEIWREETSNVFEGCTEPVISDAQGVGSQGKWSGGEQESGAHVRQGLSLCDSSNGRLWEAEPCVGRVANGIPKRMDRLRALGNAIVPQVAFVIMQNIKRLDV